MWIIVFEASVEGEGEDDEKLRFGSSDGTCLYNRLSTEREGPKSKHFLVTNFFPS